MLLCVFRLFLCCIRSPYDKPRLCPARETRTLLDTKALCDRAAPRDTHRIRKERENIPLQARTSSVTVSGENSEIFAIGGTGVRVVAELRMVVRVFALAIPSSE